MKLRKSQLMRIIVNDISFYAPVKRIIEGVGSHCQLNESCRMALQTFEDEPELCGIVAKFGEHVLQMDKV